jgi:hypothetical protein
MIRTGRFQVKTWIICALVSLAGAPIWAQNRLEKVSAAGATQQPTPVIRQANTPKPASGKIPAEADTGKKERSLAAKAALRSAMIPGWGQIYNKKYWKLPLVYGALAVPVATIAYNLDWYKKCREAYNIRYFNDTSRVVPDLPTDGIDQQLQPLSTQSLRLYRNEFRKNVDLSVLALLAIWGLNVLDATVDGHLRSFNVSDDLSLKLDPGPGLPGQAMRVGLVWRIGNQSRRTATVLTR